MHHSTTTLKKRETYFYLSVKYFRLPEVMCLTPSGKVTHLDMIAAYSHPKQRRPFTPEQIREFKRRDVKALKDLGLLQPTDADPKLLYPVKTIRGMKVFKFGPRHTTRPPYPPGMKERVFERDGHKCLECGTTERLTLDHIIPWSLGGEHTYENLRVLCQPCNSRKGARVA